MKNNIDVSINNFDFPLPDEKIAKHPLNQRDSCKLLTVDAEGNIGETVFSALPELLSRDTTLIYNNTRVINARIRLKKDSGATIEIFCLEPHHPNDYALNFAATKQCSWKCLVGNSKRWKDGALSEKLTIDGTTVNLYANRIEKLENGESIVEFTWDGCHSFASIIEAAGETPIPPYLNRDSEASDREDYQTVYSHIDGSVAAPTAGLHFTEEILNRLSDKGVRRREVTLHVGAGTFRPVKCDNVADHEMHSEYISVARKLISELAENNGQRTITAVGTTSVRTLESLYHIGCLISQGVFDGQVPQWYPYSENHPNLTVEESMTAILKWLDESSEDKDNLIADTRIIIAPGYEYRIVDRMITNFHQPHSTLLLLVSAFIGDKWREAYDYALNNDFRFLSYGDACLFDKKKS